MPIKHLLVHLDPSKQSTSRLRLACDLAARHDAHLVGLYVAQPLSPAPMFMEPAFYVDTAELEPAVQRWRCEQEEESRWVETCFQEQLRKAAISGEFRAATGDALTRAA